MDVIARWGGQEILSKLEEHGFRTLLVLRGMGPSVMRFESDVFRQTLEKGGRCLLRLPGEGPIQGPPLLHMMREWADLSERDESVELLFDYLGRLFDFSDHSCPLPNRQGVIKRSFLRLAELLSQSSPALVLILNTEVLSGLEGEVLDELMERFTSPAGNDVDGPSRLGFVLADPDWMPGIEIPQEEVASEAMVRGVLATFLEDPEILRQLWQSCGGDLGRIENALKSLPTSVVQIWEGQLLRLEGEKKELVELLAMAGQPLGLRSLRELVPELSGKIIRNLESARLVRTSIDEGHLWVSLASSEIEEKILEALSSERKLQLHRLLLEMGVREGKLGSEFIARHALACGETKTALKIGVQGLEALLSRGQWDQALGLVEELENLELDESARARFLEIRLGLAESQAAWDQALELSYSLRRYLVQPEVRGELERRIGDYLVYQGRLVEGRQAYEDALELLQEGSWNLKRGWARLGLAEIAFRSGERKRAEEMACEVLVELAEGKEKEEEQAEVILLARNLLGKLSVFDGDLTAAHRYFSENVVLASNYGLDTHLARGEANLGVVAVQERDYEEARQRLQKALEFAQLPGSLSEVNCWLNLGIVEQRRGNFKEALSYYEKTISGALEEKDTLAMAVGAHNLATLYQDMGAFSKARGVIEELKERGLEEFTGPWALLVEGQILLDEGKPEEALKILRWQGASLEGHLYEEEVLLQETFAYIALGETDEASAILERLTVEEGDLETRATWELLNRLVTGKEVLFGDASWRALIRKLEKLGLFRSAIVGRQAWSRELIDRGDHRAVKWLGEETAEMIRSRARAIPEPYQAAFLELPLHRTFLSVKDVEQLPSFDGKKEQNLAIAPVGEVPESGEFRATKFGGKASKSYRGWRAKFGSMVGESAALLRAFSFIEKIAPGEATVLLRGESGTGKELIAESIHQFSRRSGRPFVKVNCAAFVEELLLSELFGHEKGAFTGAVEQKPGRFEIADGGTIFLDEIGDISPKTQVALLRVLQEGTFERVGSAQTRSVDVRVVVATNRDLAAMVEEGTFRLDLYYRLKGFIIEMPALRERREDIPLLLHHFLRARSERGTKRFSPEVTQFLARYQWPGNVRELENFVESVLLFSEGDQITMEDMGPFRDFFDERAIDETLPPVPIELILEETLEGHEAPQSRAGFEEALVEEIVNDGLSLTEMKKRLEIKCIERALLESDGNITRAAEILQMKRPRLSQIINGSEELLALKEKLVS